MPWKEVDDKTLQTNIIVEANTLPELIEEIQKLIESNDWIQSASFQYRGSSTYHGKEGLRWDPGGFNPSYHNGIWSTAMQVIGYDWPKQTPEEKERMEKNEKEQAEWIRKSSKGPGILPYLWKLSQS